MAKWQEKADEYHEQFAARIIKALEEGTAPWQTPCPPCQENRPSRSLSIMQRK